MATSRTAKIQTEIDKAKVKLADQQNKIRELEAKRTELENMEIVDVVRGMSISLEDLAAMLHTLKGGAASIQSLGQNVPNSHSKPDKEDLPE
jgi:hypothetical protein